MIETISDGYIVSSWQYRESHRLASRIGAEAFAQRYRVVGGMLVRAERSNPICDLERLRWLMLEQVDHNWKKMQRSLMLALSQTGPLFHVDVTRGGEHEWLMYQICAWSDDVSATLIEDPDEVRAASEDRLSFLQRYVQDAFEDRDRWFGTIVRSEHGDAAHRAFRHQMQINYRQKRINTALHSLFVDVVREKASSGITRSTGHRTIHLRVNGRDYWYAAALGKRNDEVVVFQILWPEDDQVSFKFELQPLTGETAS